MQTCLSNLWTFSGCGRKGWARSSPTCWPPGCAARQELGGSAELLCPRWNGGESWPCWVAGLRGVQEWRKRQPLSTPCISYILPSFQGPCFLSLHLFILFWPLSLLIPLYSSLSVVPGLWFISGFFFSFSPHTPQVYHTIFQLPTNLSFFLLSSIAILIIPLISMLVPSWSPVSYVISTILSASFLQHLCNNKILITNINSDWLNKLCFVCIIKYLSIKIKEALS